MENHFARNQAIFSCVKSSMQYLISFTAQFHPHIYGSGNDRVTDI